MSQDADREGEEEVDIAAMFEQMNKVLQMTSGNKTSLLGTEDDDGHTHLLQELFRKYSGYGRATKNLHDVCGEACTVAGIKVTTYAGGHVGRIHQCGDSCKASKYLSGTDNEYVCPISGRALGVEFKGEWWTDEDKVDNHPMSSNDIEPDPDQMDATLDRVVKTYIHTLCATPTATQIPLRRATSTTS